MRSIRSVGCFLLAALLLSLAPPPVSAATSYYLSPTGADSGPGTQSQPWRTLAQLQTALDTGALGPGAAVYFARGATFAGSLALGGNAVGSAAAPIVFDAYGSGAAPILSGTQLLTGWQPLGGNRWRTSCASCTAIPATLLIDDLPHGLARWPNADAANGGYRSYSSFSGQTSITDPSLPGGTDWTGGELVLRTIAWILDRLPISAQQGGTLTTSTPATYDISAGWGYFIQNHPAALDQDGEWYYRAADQTITLQSPTNPNTRRVEVPAVDTLLSIRNSRYLTLRNLALRGATDALIDASGCANLTLDNLALTAAGGIGLNLTNCPNSRVTNSQIRDSMNSGMRVSACANCLVSQLTLERIGVIAGMGRGGNGQYIGAEIGGTPGSPAILEQSTVSGIGYSAITQYGPAIIRNNLARDYNRVKTDGAGIYTYRIADVQILNNLVLDAPGSKAGSAWDTTATNGIYIDDNSERITVSGNTVGRIGGAGIFLHNTRDLTVTNNTIFAAGEVGLLLGDDDLGSYAVERTLVRDNTLLLQGVPQITVTSPAGTNIFASLGVIDRNRYCDPFAPPLFRIEQSGSGAASKTLGQWRASYGYDQGSAVCSDRYVERVLVGAPGANLVTNGTFASGLTGWFGWPDHTLDARWERGRLDGGSLRLGYSGPAPTVHYDYPVGAVPRGQSYRLRLSALTLAGAPALTAYLRQAGEPYARVSQTLPILVDASRSEHELFFDVSANTADTLLIMELNAPGSAVGLDNIALQAVTATSQTLADVVRFETNWSATQRTVTLDAARYHGLDGRVYAAGSRVSLPAYGTLLLLRQQGALGRRGYLPLTVR